MGRPLKWTVEQELPLVLSILRGEGSVAEIGRRHQVSDATLTKWRDAFLSGGAGQWQHCCKFCCKGCSRPVKRACAEQRRQLLRGENALPTCPEYARRDCVPSSCLRQARSRCEE